MNITTYRRSGILIIFFLFLSGIIFSSCSSIQPVIISGITHVRSTNLFSNPEISFDLGIKNPNRYGVKVKRMGINVMISDSTIAGLNIPEKTLIPGNATINIPVTVKPSVSAFTNSLFGGIKNLISGKGSQQIEIKGEIVFSKFIFTKKVLIHEKIKL